MVQCTRCEHELGVGRFCTSCGHPIADTSSEALTSEWSLDTAERPAASAAAPPARRPVDPPAAPPVPPPAYGPPPQARYPLFADQLDDDEEAAHDGPLELLGDGFGATTSLAARSGPAEGRHHDDRRLPRAVPYLLGALALVLVAGLGLTLLTSGEDDVSDRAGLDPRVGSGATEPSDDGSASTSPSEPTSTAPTSEPPATDKPGKPGKPGDVARTAKATVPDTAAPSRDVRGNAVRYTAFNMLDGVSQTAWRMPGSAEGTEIVVKLATTSQITSVGMINGYAKVEPGYDGYAANRRILRVEWVFDDGTVLAQRLEQTTKSQTIKVPQISTSTVRLRILDVSNPGRGKSGRNFTAISDLTILGLQST